MPPQVYHVMKFKEGQNVKFTINNQIVHGIVLGCSFIKGALMYRIKATSATTMNTNNLVFSVPHDMVKA